MEMRSVPSGSRWVRPRHSRIVPTHPLPHGGTDFIGPPLESVVFVGLGEIGWGNLDQRTSNGNTSGLDP